ncbi:MAG: class I SAM-dependent methyltransferase [Phycisphaerae bacterium]|jgi:SAM-dependent methyltransferase
MPQREWHEDDTFWLETEAAVFTEERWTQAVVDVDRVLALTNPAKDAAILDLGCGVGRHALEFARRGYRVTGVDRTQAYLDQAVNKAKHEKLNAEWVQADMREFRRNGEFDLVVNLLTTFGYFEDRAEDERVAANACASLKPGGAFIIELMGKEVIARIFRPFDWQRLPDGTLFLEERKLSSDWTRLCARWILIKGDRRVEREFELRLYAASELKQLLLKVGFVQVDACGSLDGRPYDHEAERLALVARK